MDDKPLDHTPEVEEVTAELVEGGWVRKEELCVQLGIEREMLELCIQWEIVHPSHVSLEGAILFSGEVIDRLTIYRADPGTGLPVGGDPATCSRSSLSSALFTSSSPMTSLSAYIAKGPLR